MEDPELQEKVARFQRWAMVIAVAFVFLPPQLAATLLVPYICFLLLKTSGMARAFL